jgi:hypothetical protein
VIEGMAVFRSRVFLGLGGPIIDGLAMIIELNIPVHQVDLKLRKVDTRQRFRRHTLDLGGDSIKDLIRNGEDDLLVLSGPPGGLGGSCNLWRWPGGSGLMHLMSIPGGGRNKEEIGGGCLIRRDREPSDLLVDYRNPGPERCSPDGVFADAFSVPGLSRGWWFSELYRSYRDKTGQIRERGLLSRQAFSKKDITTVLIAMRDVNPAIQIAPHLIE